MARGASARVGRVDSGARARAGRGEQLGCGQRPRQPGRRGAAVELGQRDAVRGLRQRRVPQGGRRRGGLGRLVGERGHAEGAGHEQGQHQRDQQPPPAQSGTDRPGLSWHGAPPAAAGAAGWAETVISPWPCTRSASVRVSQPWRFMVKAAQILIGQRDPGDDERHQRDDRDVARVLPQVGQPPQPAPQHRPGERDHQGRSGRCSRPGRGVVDRGTPWSAGSPGSAAP